jgi:hypothetical protein
MEKVTKQFGKTERVSKLIGLQKESEGNFHEANEIYTSMLEQDQANTVRHILFCVYLSFCLVVCNEKTNRNSKTTWRSKYCNKNVN